jgi:hypothetical protein
MGEPVIACLVGPTHLADLSRRNPMKAEVGQRQKSDAGRRISASQLFSFSPVVCGRLAS